MRRALLLIAISICLVAPVRAQSADEAAIRAAMAQQAEAWGRGDIDGFMESYERSAETMFIGSTVRKGWEPILKRYKQAYKTKEQMGALSYTDLEVHLLPSSCGAAELALVTGRFHLARSAHGEAAKDEGVFSLVFRKGPEGWKVILDHTS